MKSFCCSKKIKKIYILNHRKIFSPKLSLVLVVKIITQSIRDLKKCVVQLKRKLKSMPAKLFVLGGGHKLVRFEDTLKPFGASNPLPAHSLGVGPNNSLPPPSLRPTALPRAPAMFEDMLRPLGAIPTPPPARMADGLGQLTPPLLRRSPEGLWGWSRVRGSAWVRPWDGPQIPPLPTPRRHPPPHSGTVSLDACTSKSVL